LIRDEIMCQAKEAIQVKGFAEPVHTYQVLGTKASLAQRAQALNQKLDGFSLDMNTALLTGTNKHKVKEILEQALSLIKS